MYKIKNGILEENGKKIFAVGESYYPSFYPYKYPVPPEGDRVGEMKKDFAMMKSLGFNYVRIAAIGTVKLSEDGSLAVDTPFVGKLLKEAERVGLSISVRLQGYSVNLRDFKDVCMIDADGKPQDLSVWYDFIQTTLCHGGILEDNRFLSEKLSKYYSKYKSVAGFQIYNEPHFPGMEIFDYHPTAIASYRKWLVAHGEISEAEAQTYEPPQTRKEQPPKMWALWRLFSQESLSDFLDNASVPAKTARGRQLRDLSHTAARFLSAPSPFPTLCAQTGVTSNTAHLTTITIFSARNMSYRNMIWKSRLQGVTIRSLPCKRPTATGAKYSRIQTSRAKTNRKTSQSACPRT